MTDNKIITTDMRHDIKTKAGEMENVYLGAHGVLSMVHYERFFSHIDRVSEVMKNHALGMAGGKLVAIPEDFMRKVGDFRETEGLDMVPDYIDIDMILNRTIVPNANLSLCLCAQGAVMMASEYNLSLKKYKERNTHIKERIISDIQIIYPGDKKDELANEINMGATFVKSVSARYMPPILFDDLVEYSYKIATEFDLLTAVKTLFRRKEGMVIIFDADKPGGEKMVGIRLEVLNDEICLDLDYIADLINMSWPKIMKFASDESKAIRFTEWGA